MSFNLDEFNDRGFVVLSESMSTDWVRTTNDWNQTHGLVDRGHDVDGNYIAKAKHDNRLVNMANWWSQDVTDLQFVADAEHFFMPHIARLLDNPVLYHSDFVVTTLQHRGVRPHIDTPYRFESFADEDRLLGVQCLIPLHRFNSHTGGTGFVPGSHHKKWDIKKCYRGEYNQYFIDNCHQPILNAGELLMWHPRVLHSAMPNYSAMKRTALLMLFVEREYYDEIKVIDNIFM